MKVARGSSIRDMAINYALLRIVPEKAITVRPTSQSVIGTGEDALRAKKRQGRIQPWRCYRTLSRERYGADGEKEP
ncbi:hypothetical protein GEV33_004734 [Tenebrio molitor]|uniref:Uncharacterized protein n=1 Tax=Tenebrio molitor TaxID=7067 RepID=A0A8J6HP56_TENMO|nr:hypothetical protein GEV33_004734 [Tenebrio molitor]